jgi:glycosidase
VLIPSGPSWTYDEKTDQWYCHTFLREQPDLNWENPEVREAIWDLMHWWMQKGSDGFRMDVVSLQQWSEGPC